MGVDEPLVLSNRNVSLLRMTVGYFTDKAYTQAYVYVGVRSFPRLCYDGLIIICDFICHTATFQIIHLRTCRRFVI